MNDAFGVSTVFAARPPDCMEEFCPAPVPGKLIPAVSSTSIIVQPEPAGVGTPASGQQAGEVDD